MIDLRSDTTTRPTEEMVAAVAKALADPRLADVQQEEDPALSALEQKAATVTGKEEAIFMPSGTMGNLAAVFAHRKGGVEIIVDSHSHIGRSEHGGMSAAASMHSIRVPSRKGEMDLDILRKAIQAGLKREGMPPSLICLETSHNHSGGYVPGIAHMAAVKTLAQDAGIPVHFDGARIFNAAAFLGLPVSEVAAYCDTLSFCVSKGLSAPYGALLAGDKAFIARARTFRGMLGGAMRQIGGMAAAALVALETMPARLHEDHRRLRTLWAKIREFAPALVAEDEPQTNIMFLRPKKETGLTWQKALEKHGVRASVMAERKVRLVTHRHITDEDIDGAAKAIAAVYAELGE
ncbi:MAG: L-allo-threonine aldolase [Desulfovibrio sp.]